MCIVCESLMMNSNLPKQCIVHIGPSSILVHAGGSVKDQDVPGGHVCHISDDTCHVTMVTSHVSICSTGDNVQWRQIVTQHVLLGRS